MTRLTITITNADTAEEIERLSKELRVSFPDVVGLAVWGKLPK